MIARDLAVPPTWVVRASVDDAVLDREVSPQLAGTGTYAVRSSANIEDGAERSYAGQFTTRLDVSAVDVPAAIRGVRASIGGERVASYRDHLGAGDGVAMHVIVQPMVQAVAAGVSFSRNPITGLNEVVVEAVRGRGDRLVDDGVTPDRWIDRWGVWRERPDGGCLPESAVASIVTGTREIGEAFGAPVDLEWVWDGAQVWWLQLRPITGLGEVAIYSNRISREVMPGIIKPLVWSINVPMVNRAWVDLFTEAIGPNDIEPESLAKSFAYRSYFNMGAIGDIFELLGMPRDSLEMLLGLPAGADAPSVRPSTATMRLLPRMLRLVAGKARYGRSVMGEVHSLMSAYRRFDRSDLSALSDAALLAEIHALSALGVRAAYANIVTPLLANLHHAVMRRRLAAVGLDPEAVDLGGTAELADVNPNPHLDVLRDRVDGLEPAVVDAIRVGGYAALPGELRTDVDAFLDRFGHLSASGNDFSVAPWRETPDAVVTMILDHAAAHGAATRVDWGDAERRFRAPVRPMMRAVRRRARQAVEHREAVSFTYTYGYGLFRRYFTEVGSRLAQRGAIPDPGDVMYLSIDEVRSALIGRDLPLAPTELVAQRKAEIEAVRDVVMPEVIYGDDFVPVHLPPDGRTLRGIPSSRGHHRGTVRVVTSMDDFGKVEAGDVIAIPFSDVGWTPLFARAGAVIAESGGMLSHSSIVAREYRVPCVVSVAGATRLPDGASVVVDGYAGTVVVEDEAE
jgi:pyruvate,water dikinase